MKITFLCPNLRISGGIRAVLTYADRLAERGHAVEVVVPTRRRLTAFWANARAKGPRWFPGFRPRVRWVKEFSPQGLPGGDIVVATSWPTAPVVAAAPPSSGVKFYFIQAYESLFFGAPDLIDPTYRLPLKKIVISHYLRDLMRDRFGNDAEVLVTPVDPKLFRPVPVATTSGRPRVLMLHSEQPWKGVPEGLEAFALVKRRLPALHLVGYGVRPPKTPLPYDEFHANLPQDRLAALYSGCDIFLWPAWEEGLGMPPMEAMACGAALVTYDNGGCRDYARDGETALIAKRRDVADLAAKLELLAGDEGLRAKIAAAGQAFVTTEFDWDRAVRRLEELFMAARTLSPQ